MKKFYFKAIIFWFILLILAFFNAIVREITYKPILTPYIGMWAHQISTITAIILFYIAIYFFLKRIKEAYTKTDLLHAGMIWIVLTIIFESFMNIFIRKITLSQVLATYYFWQGETWIFVLISLLILPLIANSKLKKN